MNWKNPRTHLTIHGCAFACGGLILLSMTLSGVGFPAAAAQPEPPNNDVEVPTPSPSDAPPPVVEPDEEAVHEVPVPAVCAPVLVEPAPAPCDVVRCRRVLRRCRPRASIRRCLPRRRVCCPCPVQEAAPAEQEQVGAWRPLFDGETLNGWKPTKFGGEGKVEVRDGMIVMEIGADMTGITLDGEPLKANYELELQGQRLAGHDFFCTTTFPVGEEFCSLVVGGWGGTVVGLSNVDFYDASDNLTTAFKDFKNDTWYAIRIRVSDHKITAWIDDEKMVEQPREGHRFDVRMEVDLSRPLGVSTWQSSGAVRNIRIRRLTDEEIAADVLRLP